MKGIKNLAAFAVDNVAVAFVLFVFLFSAGMTLSVVARIETTGTLVACACVLINVLMDFAAVMMARDAYEEFKAR